eukprot:86685_1
MEGPVTSSPNDSSDSDNDQLYTSIELQNKTPGGTHENAHIKPISNMNNRNNNTIIQRDPIVPVTSINSETDLLQQSSDHIITEKNKNHGTSILITITIILSLYSTAVSTYLFLTNISKQCDCTDYLQSDEFISSISILLSSSPTISPIQSTNGDTLSPTPSPTLTPSINPSAYPTISPTTIPTVYPTVLPSNTPTSMTIIPSLSPTASPTIDPIYIVLMNVITAQNITLNGLIKNNKNSIINNAQSIVSLTTSLDDLETGNNIIPINYLLVGSFPNNGGTTLIISTLSVPNTAKKILVMVQIYSGSAGFSGNGYCYLTTVANGKTYEHRLFYKLWAGQDAFSYNSDSIWLPYPDTGQISVSSDQPWSGNVGGNVYVIAYSQ